MLGNDSLIYGGMEIDNINKEIPVKTLNFEENSLRFTYAAAFYENTDRTQYQYKLEGFDKEWSILSRETRKEYTKIPPGNYTFKVKARNVFQTESKEAIYKFVVLPPSYQSVWAYLIYFVLAVSLIYVIVWFYSRRLKAANIHLEMIVIERTAKISKQKEEIQTQSLELEKANSELRTLNATKDKFFNIIAHDLRTPFNTLLGFSELLLENLKNQKTGESYRFAEIIMNISSKTFELLENLLTWSRSQTCDIEFKPEKQDIKKLIDGTIDLLRNSAENKKITLSSNIQNSLPVFADLNMVNTILRNLITNAIKFSGQDDRITITAEETDDCIIVSVSDTGIGISPENITKLFRVDENFITKGTAGETGTGLGLILCKEFIDKNNGKIWAESVLGEGTCFYFTLQKG